MIDRKDWRSTKAIARQTMAVLGLAALSAVAVASPANPDPVTWATDTGAIALKHQPASFAFELSSISGPNLPMFFGFYFNGTGGQGNGGDGLPNAGVMFDPGDPVGDKAVIDFA